MLCTRIRFLRLRSRLQSGQWSKSCLSNNSKRTEANLTKLHRKIEHNEKVCRAHELVPTPKVKVTIRKEVKVGLKSGVSNN